MAEGLTERPILGGTDGYRGRFTDEAGEGRVNFETFSGLTSALLLQPETQYDGPVIIAQDTRPSSDTLRQAVIEGALLASAEQIVDLNTAPTPMAQKVAQHLGARATVVVTASHNPAAENGWKGMIASNKPNSTQVRAISHSYYNELADARAGLAVGQVDLTLAAEMREWYHDSVVATISQQFGDGVLADKLFVYDGAQGAARELAPRILRSLGAEVIEFACDGTGLINDGCGAADIGEDKREPSGLEKFLRVNPKIRQDSRFVGAIANDGDGDRVLALAAIPLKQATVRKINGNHMMWALAQGEDGIVGTIYTNTGLRRSLGRLGIKFDECDNGDRYVTEALRRRQAAGEPWRRGGEFTGHLIDTDWLGSGDGLFQGAWYAADTVSRGMTFADRYDELVLWPEKMRTLNLCRDVVRPYLESDEYLHQLKKWEELLGDDGRVIIRSSGTEDKLRVWGEATPGRDISQITMYIARHIAKRAVGVS